MEPTMAAPEPSPQAHSVLGTRRLELRQLALDDASELLGVCNDPAVRRHLFDGELVSEEAAGAMIRRSERDFAEGGVGLFGLRLRGMRGLIGFCGLFVAEGVGEPELAYALLPSWWGRGLATEAARVVAGHALSAAGLRRVLVAADGTNAASARVIGRLGARPLGRIPPSLPGVNDFEVGATEVERWLV